MKKTVIVTALAIATIAVAPAAHADTYDEQVAKLTERFKKADTNGDGKLTKEEAKAGGMTRVAKYFSRTDKDGDGFVTLDQLKAMMKARS